MKRKLAKLLSMTMVSTMLFSSLNAFNINVFNVVQTFAQDGDEVIALADMNIIAYEGELETAYVKWNAVQGATGYKAYIKNANSSEWIKLDNALIRNYGSYYRADAVGISGGNYTMKVEALDSSANVISTAETPNIEVVAQERTGYAFVSSDKVNVSNGLGAYKLNGELKDDAIVLYVTETNKNTITADIITDAKGNKTTGTGLQGILNLLKKGTETRPICIRLIGTVTDPAETLQGDIVIDGNSKFKGGVTFEGIGDDATVRGWGIRLKNISNCEVRNLGIMLVDSSEGDDIGLQQGNDHIWVHNCDFFYGEAGGDSDQAKGDGALDCKKSTYVTMSYNHFFDNGKCCLLGLSEGSTDGYFITYHHNWFDHSDSRHPRIRFYTAHVYNNYYDGNAKYGIGSTRGSSVFSENNYFRNCKYPMLTSMQGSDVYDAETGKNDYKNLPTFSSEDGGTIKAFGNVMVGQKRFVSQNDNVGADIDAYLVSSRDEQVPNTIQSVKGGNTYNNFDTQANFYKYTPDKAEDVPAKVTKYAGRLDGGDFKWQFNNEVDDTSYAVNKELMTAIRNYKTSLVSVGGMDSESVDNGSSGGSSGGNTGGSTGGTTGGNTGGSTGGTTGGNTGGSTGGTTGGNTNASSGFDIWDFGNSNFSEYPSREDFGDEGVETKINGLSIYYPASDLTSKKVTASDGTNLTKNFKFNKWTTEFGGNLRNTIKLKAVKGETIRVYIGGNSGIVTNFADGSQNKVYSSSATKSSSVEIVDYKVEKSDTYYIYCTEANGSIYKVQTLDATGKDSSGKAADFSSFGDVDANGEIHIDDTLKVLEYVLNPETAGTSSIDMLVATDGEDIDINTVKKMLDKIVSTK